MQLRWTIVSACAMAALVAPARADHHEGASSATAQASEPEAGGPGSASGEAAEAPHGPPGMLPGQAEPDRPGAAQGVQQTVIGTVKKVEKDAVTVQSSALSDPHELTLGADTKLLREDGSSMSRAQLREGDMVRAVYVGEGNSGEATEIQVIQERKGSGG